MYRTTVAKEGDHIDASKKDCYRHTDQVFIDVGWPWVYVALLCEKFEVASLSRQSPLGDRLVQVVLEALVSICIAIVQTTWRDVIGVMRRLSFL